MNSLLVDSASLSPVIIMVITGITVLLVDVLSGKDGPKGYLAGVAAFGTALAALVLVFQYRGLVEPRQLFGGMVVLDRLALIFQIFMALAALGCILLSVRYSEEHALSRGDYYGLFALSTSGAMLLAMSADLLMLFISVELMSIGLYALAGIRRSSPASAEAALKYFIYGALASAFILLGVAYLWGITGTTRLDGIMDYYVQAGGLKGITLLFPTALLILLTGLGFKVALAPFHMWAPDVYDGSPAPVTAFMVSVVKAAGFAALLRVMLTAFFDWRLMLAPFGWFQVLLVLSVVTMFVGNLAALHQSSMKRMLAYSSVAHAGYAVMGLVATIPGHMVKATAMTARAAELKAAAAKTAVASVVTNLEAEATKLLESAASLEALAEASATDAGSSVIFYVITYGVASLGAFGVVALLGEKGEEHTWISDYAGLGYRKPALALVLTLCLVSLAGLPPTAGFAAKWFVFRDTLMAGNGLMAAGMGLKTGHTILYWLVGLGLFNSLIALYYYLRPVLSMYVRSPHREVRVLSSGWAAAVLAVVAFFILQMGLFPGAYVESMRSAVGALVGG